MYNFRKGRKQQPADAACFAWEDAKFCHTSQHEVRGFFNKKGKHQCFKKASEDVSSLLTQTCSEKDYGRVQFYIKDCYFNIRESLH